METKKFIIVTKQGKTIWTEHNYAKTIDAIHAGTSNLIHDMLCHGEDDRGHKISVPLMNVAYFKEVVL